MESILAELTGLFEHLPADSIFRAADVISSHARIFLYGAGRSGLMLKAFAMRLAQMGKTVYVAGETTTPAIGCGDLLITASASGTTGTVVRNARIAKEAGADLLIISARGSSPLADIHPVDILLNAATKDGGSSTQIMGSLFEQALLLLCDKITANLPHDAATMRKNHANLE